MPVRRDWSEKLKQFVEEWKRNPNGEQYIGDTPFATFVVAEPANSCPDFIAWLGELQGSWCFRGQREVAGSLLTSLDRADLLFLSVVEGNRRPPAPKAVAKTLSRWFV